MQYRSVSNLASLVDQNLHRVPKDVDLVAGVPRSGMLVASLVALKLNLPLTDVFSVADDRPLKAGYTRRSSRGTLSRPSEAKHILVVDDSISTGESLARTKALLSNLMARKTFCAAFSTQDAVQKVDLCFEILPLPRIFEWNVLHHKLLELCCLDIDGILCPDPSPDANDDGARYLEFLLTAPRLVIPTGRIGHLVSSRLEKYRSVTEEWLRAAGVDYGRLHLLDLPSAAERRRLQIHGKFKAAIYKGLPETHLFIESERQQAIDISQFSGKASLCLPTNELFLPGFTVATVARRTQRLSSRIRRWFAPVLGKS